MAKQTDLYLTDTIAAEGVEIDSADTTSWMTVYTAGADDALVKALSATSDDTAAINLRVGIDFGAGALQIGCVNIPAASGTSGGAPAIDLLNSTDMPGLAIDRNGKRHLLLPGGAILKVACLVTMTAAKTLTVVAQAEEY